MSLASQTGSLTSASGGGSTVTLSLPTAEPTCTSALITVNDDTSYTGVTVAFEASDDSGTNWYSVLAYRADTGASAATAALTNSSLNAWWVDVTGFNQLRLRCSVYGSGTVGVHLVAGVWPIPVSLSLSGSTATANQGTQGASNSPWYVRVTDGSNSQPTGDTVARASFVKLTDGTNTAPTFDAVARPGFVKITDGTNTAPTLDAVGRAGFVKLTDGTNTAPTFDSTARPGFVKITDGTNTLLSGSAANISANVGTGSILAQQPGNWAIAHTPSSATQATISKGAVASTRHVATGIYATLVTVGTAQGTAIQLNLRDGATGAGTILWSKSIALTTNSVWNVDISDICIPGSVNTAMTLEFSAAGATATVQSVSLTGFSTT